MGDGNCLRLVRVDIMNLLGLVLGLKLAENCFLKQGISNAALTRPKIEACASRKGTMENIFNYILKCGDQLIKVSSKRERQYDRSRQDPQVRLL